MVTNSLGWSWYIPGGLDLLDVLSTTITGELDFATGGAGTGGTNIASKIVFVDDAYTLSNIKGATTDDHFFLAANAQAIVIYGDKDGTSTDLKVYHVLGTHGGGAAAHTETITEVATLSSVDATAFVAGNFVYA